MCAALLAASGATASAAGDASTAAKRPDIVLITLDTTRADHLGAYGYERDTTPHLDRLAVDAAVYQNAYSTTTWTLPSHASLLTGKFPTSHGAMHDAEGPLIRGDAIDGPEFFTLHRARGISGDETTMADILRAEGYATGAVVAGPWLKRLFGLARGFDHYDDQQISSVRGRLAEQVTTAAIEWLEASSADSFFLFLNYYDPHGPYTDPAGLAARFLPPDTPIYPPPENPSAEFRHASYDGEIMYMDRHLGRLFDYLRAQGRYDDAWILVTADHGELLGEHDTTGHGYSLYEAELRIPLLIKSPRGQLKSGPRDERIQLTDILPLLLTELDLPIPDGVQGRARAEDRPDVYAEVYPLGGRAQWRALIHDGVKFLWNSEGKHELYALKTDPDERIDLCSDRAGLAKTLEAATDALFAALPRPSDSSAPTHVDTGTREALRSLGYLPDSGEPIPAEPGAR